VHLFNWQAITKTRPSHLTTETDLGQQEGRVGPRGGPWHAYGSIMCLYVASIVMFYCSPFFSVVQPLSSI
jgi:hypothetical protein